jgi:hypothetical protein
MTKNIIFIGLVLIIAACGGKQNEKYPNTGNADNELMVSYTIGDRSDLVEGEEYWVSTGVRIRSSDEVARNALGIVNRNDKVRVVNVGPFRGDYVQVEVTETRSNISQSDRYFMSFKYLEKEKVDHKKFKGDLFVIQNIATERLRVYKRVCADNSCPHKMVLETELAVGEDKDNTVRTWPGSYRLTKWHKFYQDSAKHYPRWFMKTKQENDLGEMVMEEFMPPKAGKSFRQWMRKKYMPRDSDGKRYGSIRGAFGWYTAHVGPNSNSQWTHGTVGWGSDKKKYIHYTKKKWANILVNPRSSGCSRTDNESIAYLREILPVGTPFIKIYAKEALLDPTLKGYSPINKKWDYNLTSAPEQKADAATVLIDGIKENFRSLEVGTYDVDQYPTIIEYQAGEDLRRTEAATGNSGNVYRVESEKMNGVYYIDAGFVSGYTTPKHDSLVRGGFPKEEVGPWMNMDKL